MPDPSIGPRYSGNRTSSTTKKRVDTSSLSGIEAASKGPTTEQKLVSQPTKTSTARVSAPITRDPKPTSTFSSGNEPIINSGSTSTGGSTTVGGSTSVGPTSYSYGGNGGRSQSTVGGPVSIERIERESAARIENADKLAESVNALGTSGGYATEVMRDELVQTLTDIEGGDAEQARKVLQQVDQGVSVSEARVIARQAPEITVEPAPLTDVDQAVEELDEAIEQRDAARHPFEQERHQGRVDQARENLQTVIREDVDNTRGGTPPYFGSPTLDQRRDAATDIIIDYADDPAVQREVQRAADAVIIDIEVDDTINLVEGQSNSDRAYNVLSERFDDVSPEAQARLLQHDTVDDVLDDVVSSATAPLSDVDTTIYPHLLTDEAVVNVESLVVQAGHPDLAAEVVARAQPALNQALVDNANRDSHQQELIGHYSVVDRLGVISDSIVGSKREDELVSGLASFVIEGSRNPTYEDARVTLPSVREGVGLPLALEIANQLDADPNIDARLVVDQIVGDYEQYAETAVNENLTNYAEHTAELNFLIASTADLPDEDRQRAINGYLEGKDEQWHDDLERMQNDIASTGSNLLFMQQRISESPHLSESSEQKIEAVAATDDFEAAIQFGLQTNPDAFFGDDSNIDVDRAITFLDGVGAANSSGSLSRAFTNAYIQNTVIQAVANADSLNDPRSYAQATEALDELRPTLYNIPGASEADVDAAIDGFNTLLSDLRDTQVSGTEDLGTAYEEAFKKFESQLEDASIFGPDRPLGKSFRVLGVSAGVIAAKDSFGQLAQDPTYWNGFVAAVDGLSLVQDGGEVLIDLGHLSDDGAFAGKVVLNENLGKALGVAGLAIGSYGVYKDFQEGNHATAAWGAGGVVGGGIALGGSALSVAWAGPVGLAIGLIAFGGSFLGAKVDASNQFTGDAAREFFEDAGFEEHAAQALADRSGDGHSPVPILIKYGAENGLSVPETIDWINSLSKDQLDWVRDRFHYTLDKIDGDLSDFQATHVDDSQWISIGYTGPISATHADWVLRDRGIPVPGE